MGIRRVEVHQSTPSYLHSDHTRVLEKLSRVALGFVIHIAHIVDVLGVHNLLIFTDTVYALSSRALYTIS